MSVVLKIVSSVKKKLIEKDMSPEDGKNEDGYNMCGMCYAELSSPTCESYFCSVCYVSLSENCVCPK